MAVSTELEPRKSPRQRRAKDLVEALLDATARVLVEEGYDKTSTNRVAKRAGVSVGSLYQYFPNKEALVLGVARRHSEEMMEVLQRHVFELGDAPIAGAVRAYVRAMVEAHAVDPALHSALVQQVLHLGMQHLEEPQLRARALVRAWLERHQDQVLPTDLDAASFVLVAAVEAVTHGAVIYEPGLLGALEDEVVALVLRYLLGEAR